MIFPALICFWNFALYCSAKLKYFFRPSDHEVWMCPRLSSSNFVLRYYYINAAHSLILSNDIYYLTTLIFQSLGEIEVTTGVRNLDNSIDLTNVWFRDILSQLKWQSKESAYQALRGTLHALRDRLPAEEAVELASQLPLLVKGMYYDGWTLRDKPEKFKKEEFARRVHAQFEFDDNVNPAEVIRAVLRVMYRHMGEGELRDVRSNMPKDIQEWFPEEVAPRG